MSSRRIYSERQKLILIEIGRKFRKKIYFEMISTILSVLILCLFIIYGLFSLLNNENNLLPIMIFLFALGIIIGSLNLVQYIGRMVAFKKSDDFTVGLHYKFKDPSIIGNSKLILSNQVYPALIIAILVSIIFGLFFYMYINNKDNISWLVGSIILALITVFCLVWFLVHKLYIYKQNLKKEKYDFELCGYEINEIIQDDLKGSKEISFSKSHIVVKSPEWAIYLFYFIFIFFTTVSIIMYFHFDDITSKIVSSSIMGTFAFLSIIAIISGYIEKEILTNSAFEKHRLFKKTIIPLSDIKIIQYLGNTIKIVNKGDNNYKWLVCSNRDISDLLEGFKQAGIFVEPLV